MYNDPQFLEGVNQNKILTEWYENDVLDKIVTFSKLHKDDFTVEIKGKGKIVMKKVTPSLPVILIYNN